MKRAPLEGRRILTTIIKQTGVETVYFISRKQADQIVVQDLPRGLFVHANFIESFGLSFENRGVPSAREEGRIGAEEQALRAHYVEGAPEHVAEIEMSFFVSHPAIATRSIQVYVRA